MDFESKRINEGMNDYLKIMELVKKDNFCTPEFRKIFNHFYRIRQKSQFWYECYYELFEKCKKENMTFETVLTELFEKTGEIHPSFCSKMIATVDPNKAIWDQYVLQWLGFVKNDPIDKYEKIKYYCKIYEQINKEYNEHLEDKNIVEAFDRFDKEVNNGSKLTKVKKLDFILWSNRSDRTVSILDYLRVIEK